MRRPLIVGFCGFAERTARPVAALAKGGSLPQHFANRRRKQQLRLTLDHRAVLHGGSAAAQKNG
ncbi:MAG TPA: hypothetical protein VGA12_02665 [Burkholderiales bacterium]|jgi:hypothetical protein